MGSLWNDHMADMHRDFEVFSVEWREVPCFPIEWGLLEGLASDDFICIVRGRCISGERSGVGVVYAAPVKADLRKAPGVDELMREEALQHWRRLGAPRSGD